MNTQYHVKSLCLLVAACNLEAARADCTFAPSGLIAWWRAENNALDSAGANHGTLQNGAMFAAGHVGGAFSLDGTNDFVQVPHSAALNTPTGITVEAWIKVTGTNAWNVVASKYDSSSGQTSWALLTRADGALRFSVFDSVSPVRNQFADSASGVVVSGVATHVVGTFDPLQPGLTQVKLYANGVELDAPAASGSMHLTNVFQSTSPVRIGTIRNQSGALSDFFHGTIDELSVYDRPLTPSEVQALYNAGTSGKCESVPMLNITALPGAVRLTWPTNATGYLLETNSALTLPAGWGVLTSNYSVLNTDYAVTNALGGATRFYRLHQP